MLRALVATIAVLTAMVAGPATPAWAQSCEAHLAKHNTSEAVDIQYHKLYGGKSPCQKDYKPGDEAHTDEPMAKPDNADTTSGSDGYKRDKFGQGCTLFGCG